MDLQNVGRYNVVERIGRGAMGEVYKAFDPVLNRHVAIKMLTAQLGLDADMRKRFEREAQSAARLTHPNIVTVFELGEEKGAIFIAMELLEGRDLKDLIGLPELRDLGERLRIMDLVLAGVSFAHERGVVHRDLKPANIRVLPNGQVKVVDFGLARMATGAEMTQAGTVMGTPNYMSPEQVRGEKADASSDVFALGAVLYELLTARRAFQTETLHTTLAKVLTDEPEPIDVIAPEVPEPVRAVVQRALSKDRSERYANGGEMRTALQAAAPTLLSARARRSGDSTFTGLAPIAGPRSRSGRATARAPQVDPEARGATLLDTDPTYIPGMTPATPPTTVGGKGGGVGVAIAVGAGLLAVGGTAVGLLLWSHRNPPVPVATPAPTVSDAQQNAAITDALVESLVQLARLDLENKQYESAIRGAEEALKQNPASTPAQQVLDRARAAVQERDDVARQAQDALARRDMDVASQRLSRLLELDPRHPSVPQLSAALNATFQQRASEARRVALQAKTEAAGATVAAGFGEGEVLLKAADDLFDKGEFAAATAKFNDARDSYGRAQRNAQAQRAERERQDAERQRQAAEAARRTAQRTAEPTRLVTPAPATATQAAATAAPTAPPTAVSTVNPQEAGIRQALAAYEQAMEGRNVGQLQAVWPSVEAKKFEASFKNIKSLDVGLKVDSIETTGGQAVVRTSRQDVMNGQRTPAIKQIFHLSQAADGWKIDSLSVGQ
jgi:tRNA A-37 threonylcarbamoyl transferase component Bud32/tetratricopeptide (TPR) repeat protein